MVGLLFLSFRKLPCGFCLDGYGYKRQLELSVKDDRYRSAKIKIRIIERKTELEACGLVPSGLIKPHTKTLACEDQDGYAGAENGNQEKASAFKDFVDGLFGTKQEKKESGAEEKAAEKGTEPPAGKTEEKTFSQAAMEKSLSKLTETFKGSLQAAVNGKTMKHVNEDGRQELFGSLTGEERGRYLSESQSEDFCTQAITAF